MSSESHPAVDRIRSILDESSFTSGTVKIPLEQCKLYYQATPTTSAFLNLATASDAELAQLVAACDAAPFGRGGETVLDDTYRKALKLELSQFALSFDLASTVIVHQIYQNLVKSPSTSLRRVVRAEPYKLNIYDKGAFFKTHQDTPRASNMFASLVVIFPTTHEGGSLVLHEKNLQWSFDAQEMLANGTPTEPEIAYVAFYSDIEHEVLPVMSGARVTLTYNLYYEEASDLTTTIAAPNSKLDVLKQSLQELINDPEFLPSGGRFGFGLNHQYSVKRDLDHEPYSSRHDHTPGYIFPELLQYLKGSDALVSTACKDLGLAVNVKILYTDRDTDGVYLGATPMEDCYNDLEDFTLLYEGMDVIRSPDLDRYRRRRRGEAEKPKELSDEDKKNAIFWVTPLLKLNQVESTFVTYGNEASLDFIYGDVCLVVDFIREQYVSKG